MVCGPYLPSLIVTRIFRTQNFPHFKNLKISMVYKGWRIDDVAVKVLSLSLSLSLSQHYKTIKTNESRGGYDILRASGIEKRRVTLRNARTYGLTSQNHLLEVRRVECVKNMKASWFVDDNVVGDDSVYVLTKMDPEYLCFSVLEAC